MPNKDGLKKTAIQDKQVKDWMSSYVGSPKYKERLANFYKYPGYIQNQRANVLKGTKISDVHGPDSSTQYFSADNELTVSEAQLNKDKTTRSEGVAHELGHAVNKNVDFKGTALSLPESKYIMQSNKGLSPAETEMFLKSAKESGKPMSKIMGGELHHIIPSENKSDVDALRFLLKQRNIYDAGTQDISPEILDKAKKDPVIRRSFIFKRLKQSFDDEKLIDVMNKVAVNKRKKQSNTA